MADHFTYLGFCLGEESFAIPVDCVQEIMDIPRITRVPRANPSMRGVVNVRGTATPVMDLRIRFGLPPHAETQDSRIMILHCLIEGEKVAVGGLADSISGVLEFADEDIAPPPRIGMRWRPEFVRGIGSKQGRFYILLDIEKLLGSPDAARVHTTDQGRLENKETHA